MWGQSIEYPTSYNEGASDPKKDQNQVRIWEGFAGKQRRSNFLNPPGHWIQPQKRFYCLWEEFRRIDDRCKKKPEHQSGGQQLFEITDKDLERCEQEA